MMKVCCLQCCACADPGHDGYRQITW